MSAHREHRREKEMPRERAEIPRPCRHAQYTGGTLVCSAFTAFGPGPSHPPLHSSSSCWPVLAPISVTPCLIVSLGPVCLVEGGTGSRPSVVTSNTDAPSVAHCQTSMSTSRTRAIIIALAVNLLWTRHVFPRVSAKVVEAMQQGFLFDWAGDQSTPIPIAAQCDTLHITWGRRSATGPNPVAPYYLQVYTSAFVVPFVIPAGSGSSFDWPLPFSPGTQFQICMFASNGVTGGCQQIYTVYPTSGSSSPVCQNLTYPAGALDVTAKTLDGTWSQYGWINQVGLVA
ncbi:hypothetical protein BD309DRAFT_606275 [Dichomitus squalens]|nr:hypothetical protein BD309DRAFT_606275 [Dichomitus squalens]